MNTLATLKYFAPVLFLIALCHCVPVAFALSPTDSENILFLKQEEKLARDVYLTLLSQWDHTTFLNISASEQQHMDAVDGLITRYGLSDTTPSGIGEFTIPELQALFDSLVSWGSMSLTDALSVGVYIEAMDIEDIQIMLDATALPPVRRVLSHLQDGSYNHLGAFSRALSPQVN